jgi:NADH-quinone oxidoreductase subunit I
MTTTTEKPPPQRREGRGPGSFDGRVTSVSRRRRSLSERVYVVEVARGLGITIRHLLANLFGRVRRYTTSFPEGKTSFPPRFRSRHRLLKKEDGSPRCTACMCCATACPAGCIYIEAAEAADPTVEKYPKTFDIDSLVCIYCGYCVEACPCDAIRMDTGLFPPAGLERAQFVDDKETLLSRSGPPGPVPGEPHGIAPISGPRLENC